LESGYPLTCLSAEGAEALVPEAGSQDEAVVSCRDEASMGHLEAFVKVVAQVPTLQSSAKNCKGKRDVLASETEKCE
jgi:hypothetical protein